MATVSGSQPWTYTLELPRDRSAPVVARALLRTALRERGMEELVDEAESLALELIVGAPAHVGGAVRLRLRGVEGGRLQVSVGGHIVEVPEEHARAAVPLTGCRECAALEAARREAEVRYGGERAVDAAIALRRHFRTTHRLPEGAAG
ncbi:ATP-binding protein [Streptomyces sp. NPDC008001]|uniref:ATP-binding protein n=1 Tax=Streptomyces sp. NPDC008001 TaxID=3364804 RepID=UPI0036E0A183